LTSETTTSVPTAAGFYLRYLLDALNGLGLMDGVSPLPEVGERVALELVDQVLIQAQARYTASTPLSLQLGQAVTPVALDVLAYASMSSHTLGDAVALLCQFETYRLGFARCEVTAEGPDTVVELQITENGSWPSMALQVETCLAGWITFGRWITASRSRPRCIELAHAGPADTRAYEAFFQCPVYFGRDRHAVHLPHALLATPLATSNPTVSHLMRDEMQRRIERFTAGALFLTQLEQAIEDSLAEGAPSLERLATRLRLSPRQLQTQVKAAGTTLPGSVDQVRQRMAQRLLAAHIPLADISQQLGYSEQSAFSRACVRWFGVSPARWRSQADHSATG